MAMASCALSCSLSPLTISTLGSSSLVSSSSSSRPGLRLAGARLRIAAPVRAVVQERRNVVVKAAADEAADVAPAAAPALPLLSQSELLKKKAKKEELRRKRLVRKRHLRKKGRWPPAKVNKTKNV